MNTTQLECFLAVADALNFSRAAERLRITQPAVSHQVKTLEDELGVQLFSRTSKSVRLTQEGHLFLQYAGEILKLAGASIAQVRQCQSGRPQYLGIGCRSAADLMLIRPALERLRREQGFLLIYAGSVGRSNGLLPLVEAASLLEGKAGIAILGNGAYKIPLKRAAGGEGNLLFLDGVDRGQLAPLLARADACYLGAKDSPLYQYGIGMNKLYDYMQAARPVLCGVKTPQNPVELAGCGLVIPPEDPAAIAQGVERLRALPREEREAMGRRGKAYLRQHHQYARLAERYLETLEEAVQLAKRRKEAGR